MTHFLAVHGDIQAQLRSNPALIPAAVEEILRLDGPLATNRRVATCPVQIGGRTIGKGEQISLNWIAANRDEHAFDDPETFRLDRDQSANLLWGAGIHVCPGAPLARLEMRICMEELLSRSSHIGLSENESPTRAVYPACGFASLWLRLH